MPDQNLSAGSLLYDANVTETGYTSTLSDHVSHVAND